MTLNPIYYELQTQLQRSQYFQIVNGEIDIDLGSIENDLNAQGAINIVYNPPGTNMICSWDNLMNQTNANYRLQFGIAESQTQFTYKIQIFGFSICAIRHYEPNNIIEVAKIILCM